MAENPPGDALGEFETQTRYMLVYAISNPDEDVPRFRPADVQSRLWQVSVGASLGVLPKDFVEEMAKLAKHLPWAILPSSVYGVDASGDALRLFFDFALLEAEIAEPELNEVVLALGVETNRPASDDRGAREPKDRFRYTVPLITAVLQGSSNVDSDAAAACLEVMSQLLSFEEDIFVFERAVKPLPHTSALVKRRFEAVHRAAEAISQNKGEPEPQPALQYV